jgi:hypothetical protein
MEKQGGMLADRPRMIAAGAMLYGGLSIGFAPDGDRLRRMRRSVVCDTTQIGFRRDAGYFIRISSLKQLRRISPCRCHTGNIPSSTFLMIHITSKTIPPRKRLSGLSYDGTLLKGNLKLCCNNNYESCIREGYTHFCD